MDNVSWQLTNDYMNWKGQSFESRSVGRRLNLPISNGSIALEKLQHSKQQMSDFCETLISISKLRLSRKTLFSFPIPTLNSSMKSHSLDFEVNKSTTKGTRGLHSRILALEIVMVF